VLRSSITAGYVKILRRGTRRGGNGGRGVLELYCLKRVKEKSGGLILGSARNFASSAQRRGSREGEKRKGEGGYLGKGRADRKGMTRSRRQLSASTSEKDGGGNSQRVQRVVWLPSAETQKKGRGGERGGAWSAELLSWGVWGG